MIRKNGVRAVRRSIFEKLFDMDAILATNKDVATWLQINRAFGTEPEFRV
jgi:hypothetical protein